MSGAEEVPSVTTTAKGEATFQFSKENDGLNNLVGVKEIENVTSIRGRKGKRSVYRSQNQCQRSEPSRYHYGACQG